MTLKIRGPRRFDSPGVLRGDAPFLGATVKEWDDALTGNMEKTLAEIKAADYALTPGRYVGAPDLEDDGEPVEEKIERLTTELFKQFEESARLEQIVREQLGKIG